MRAASLYRVFVASALSFLATAAAGQDNTVSPGSYGQNDTVSSGSYTAVLNRLGVPTSAIPPLSRGESVFGNAQFTCAVLQFLLPGNDTFAPGSPYYTPLYEISWSTTCWLTPGCVVTPNTPSDVSKILRVLTALNTTFAIRSGGHKDAPGFASVGSNGVLIALQNLNGISISPDRRVVTVGPGQRWGPVYEYLAGFGVSVAGGRLPHVGVGGLLLGGGLSFFYNSYGLGVDQVTRFQIVTPDGSIINATPTSHPDLYRALKGGMSNFGIITEFSLLTSPILSISFSVSAYAPQHIPALLSAYEAYTADPNTDPNSSVQVQIFATHAIAFYGYAVQTADPAVFRPFKSVPTSGTLFPPTNGTLGSLLALGASTQTAGLRFYGSTITHRVTSNSTLMTDTYQLFLAAAPSLPAGFSFTLAPQGICASAVLAGRARNGGNAYGLEAVGQNWIDLFVTYPTSATPEVNDANDVLAENVVNKLAAQMAQLAEKRGLGLPWLFPNNAAWTQKPLRGYGREGRERIKDVARRYDPLGVMQRLQNGGYLVSREL